MNRTRQYCRLVLLFVIVILAARAHSADTFDGITVIELEDQAASKVIGGGKDLIITFVSALGTYAAVGSGQQICVAWMVPGSYTGASITFGLPAESYSVKLFPRVCQPFSLRLEGPGSVRVEANNKPVTTMPNPAANRVQYSRSRKILLRIPLVALNWGLAPFSRHDVKGVRLGPVPHLTELAGDHMKIQVNQLQKSTQGTFKNFNAKINMQSGQASVYGRVAAAEVTGWPWDTLIGARFAEQFPQHSAWVVFEKAVTDRYGLPSPTIAKSADNAFHWLYDMNGRQLALDDQSGCGRSMRLWQSNNPTVGGTLVAMNTDLGPWGCALIMKLHYNRSGDTVGGYNIQVISGYAYAINHFLGRLAEIKEMQTKIGKVESFQPTL